jgi:HlyD family secretion protein
VVNYIAPGVDAQRGTVTIRLKVETAPAFLRQDMTVSVNVETGRRDAALVLPNDALLNADGGRPEVLAVRGGKRTRVPVQLGLKGLVMTEVVSGLQAGDLVLASAASVQDVKEGGRVRVAIEAQAAGNGDSSSRRELPVNFN